MVLPAGLLLPRHDGGQEVVEWTREAAERAELEKRQAGLVLTLGDIVISVGLNSLGLPEFTVTLETGATTAPAAAATTTADSVGDTTVPAAAPTTQATQAANTGKTTAATDASPNAVATSNAPANTATSDPESTDIKTSKTKATGTLANSSPALVLPSGTALVTGKTTGKITSATGVQTTTEVIFAGGSAITSVMTMGASATGVATHKSASPPVIAGAVVGSIGGTALLLLVLVMFLRWRRHRNDNKRISQGSESIKALHTGPAPIMPHNSARTTIFPPPPDPNPKMSFLPSGAAGWLNRLSGDPLRAASPGEERVRELRDSDDEQSFRKVAGRKVPSQFSSGTEDGPATTHFDPPDNGLTVPAPVFSAPENNGLTVPAPVFAAAENRESSGTASNHLINDNPEWFNSVHGPPANRGTVGTAERSISPVSPVSAVAPGYLHHDPRPFSYDDAGGNPFANEQANEQANEPVPAVPDAQPKPGRTVSFIPPAYANNSVATTPDQREHEHVAQHDFASDEALRMVPNRTSDIYGAPPPVTMPPVTYGAGWLPPTPQPPNLQPVPQQTWYAPYSPDQVNGRGGRVESMGWPEPPTVDWERLSRVRPRGI